MSKEKDLLTREVALTHEKREGLISGSSSSEARTLVSIESLESPDAPSPSKVNRCVTHFHVDAHSLPSSSTDLTTPHLLAVIQSIPRD